MRKDISRESFIEETSRIISAEGLRGLTIRRIGKELRCNSAHIYYYFKDLDELVAFASMEYFSRYVEEISQYYRGGEDSLQAYFKAWECFTRHTFAMPSVFEKLFYGKYSAELGRIAGEYYALFPEKLLALDARIARIVTAPDFDAHYKHLVLDRCVTDGWFAKEDEEMLGLVLLNLHRGFLQERILHEDDAAREEIRQSFERCLRRTIDAYRIR